MDFLLFQVCKTARSSENPKEDTIFEGRFVDRFYLKIGFVLIEFYSENKDQLKFSLFSVFVKHWFVDRAFLSFWK